MQLFTTAEAAAYLRLKERKIYEMVAEGAVPCTKVTGRWLFPKAELDQWLAASVTRPAGMTQPARPPIVAGSHDPLLEWALRESGCGLPLLAVGSEAGFTRFAAGEASVACMHLHDIDDLEADANIDNLTGRGDMHDTVLIGFCRREEGFLVAPGNPLKLKSLADAASKRTRITMRPKGAGAQLLLLAMLHQSKMTLDQLTTVSPVCQTGPDVAQAIRAGRADIGIATRAVANVAGLEFIPIVWEQFDLAVRQSDYFRPAFQTLIKFMVSREFAARSRELGGYDIAGAGAVRHST